MAEPPAKVEDAPDPGEDDLDDLDDVLDEFQATSISKENPTTSAPAPAVPTASGPGRPEAKQDELPSEADFAAQLQSGMSSLINELDSNPEMQAEFEKMMRELIAAGSVPSEQEAGEHLKQAAEAVSSPSDGSKAKSSPAGGATAGKKPEEFQDTILKTMQRMQASSDTATNAASKSTAQSEEDLLAQMMKELTEGGGFGDGEGDFNSMLMNMMAHLTNKEILYDPMKELHDKFPAWLEQNRSKISKEELGKYQEQQKIVSEIVGRFEKKGYSDDNEDDREYIVDRMQKMQAQGSPPSDLVGDMNAAQDAMGDLDAGCPTQ